MTSKVADSVRRGLEESAGLCRGHGGSGPLRRPCPDRYRCEGDPHQARHQEEFAGRFGFSINTLRHWEQGRRVPEGPTRAYLLVIKRNPKAVQKALRAA
jgi:putative transcriptional regulator